MLNEIYELEQYTRPIGEGENRISPEEYIKEYGKRLCYRNIKDHLKGIRRPLSVIARYYLWKYRDKEQKEEYVIKLLSSWLGFSGENDLQNEDANKLYNWFPDYIRLILSDDKEKEETLKKVLKELKNKNNLETGYNKPAFNTKLDSSDFYGISLEKIVAEALVSNDIVEEQEKLNQYYLVAANCKSENEIFDNIYLKGVEKNIIQKGEETFKKNKTQVLMTVATALLEEKTKKSKMFVRVDVENWMHMNSSNRNGYKIDEFQYINRSIKVKLDREENSACDPETGSVYDSISQNIPCVITQDKNPKITIHISGSKAKDQPIYIALYCLKDNGRVYYDTNGLQVDEEHKWIELKRTIKWNNLSCGEYYLEENETLAKKPQTIVAEDTDRTRSRLFELKSIVSSFKLNRLEIDEDWNQKCGWILATEKELNAITSNNPDVIYYRDYYFREDEKYLQLQKRYK